MLKRNLIIVFFVPLLAACSPQGVVFSSATTAAVTVSQERSVGSAIDDTAIDTEINHYFFQKDVNDLFTNVNIVVNEGRVMLTGAVDKAETRDMATRLAWQASGVSEVINEIQVAAPNQIFDRAGDEWTEAQIDARFFATRIIKSQNYEVEVVNGVVYVIGIAQDEQELRRALHIVSTTGGVKKVVSHVVLKGDPRRLAPE